MDNKHNDFLIYEYRIKEDVDTSLSGRTRLTCYDFRHRSKREGVYKKQITIEVLSCFIPNKGVSVYRVTNDRKDRWCLTCNFGTVLITPKGEWYKVDEYIEIIEQRPIHKKTPLYYCFKTDLDAMDYWFNLEDKDVLPDKVLKIE